MLIYLASPYTHPDRAVEDDRFDQVVHIAGRLIEQGFHIFCPIAMCHPIARMARLDTKFDYWREFDQKCLNACGELWVTQLSGWQVSAGIHAEIEIMNTLGKPIYLLDPGTLFRSPLRRNSQHDSRTPG